MLFATTIGIIAIAIYGALLCRWIVIARNAGDARAARNRAVLAPVRIALYAFAIFGPFLLPSGPIDFAPFAVAVLGDYAIKDWFGEAVRIGDPTRVMPAHRANEPEQQQPGHETGGHR